MRYTIHALAAAAALAVAVPATRPAAALTLPAPSALGAVADEAVAAEAVRYVCRRWWNGRRWVSRCHWRPGPVFRPWRHGHRRHWR